MKIQDLIQVPPIKTVIQLSETEDSSRQQMTELLNTFVITEETGHNLRVVLQAIDRGTVSAFSTQHSGTSLQPSVVSTQPSALLVEAAPSPLNIFGTPSAFSLQPSAFSLQSSASPPNGCGMFLQGHYGTGKSHFLSFLSILLEHAWAWDVVGNGSRFTVHSSQPREGEASSQATEKNRIFEEFGHLRDNRYLVVKIPLQHYSAAHTLEDIVFAGVERQFNRTGEGETHARTQRHEGAGTDPCVCPPSAAAPCVCPLLAGDQAAETPSVTSGIQTQTGMSVPHTDKPRVILARTGRLLDNFNRYILPRHPDFLDSLGLDSGQWQEMVEQNQDNACRLAVKYLETLETLPIRLEYDRDDSFRKIEQYRIDYGYDGLVLILDELSEFLRAKSTPASFNEDIRFLQHLGEEATGKPLWIIASLQEQIEETGHIQQNLFNRIKDRYPKRLTISSRHITDLISHRLIIKKPGAADSLKSIYKQLREAFPQLEISFERFADTYPVHPQTLKMLEGLMRLFSQHRGVVDYIHYQIAGDESRKIPGILQQDASYLLSPDTIFDHFSLRIREMVETQGYYNIAYRYFEQHIPEIFEDSSHQAISMRLIKILILTEISPIEKRHTLRELTCMLLHRVSGIESSLNYDFLREVILNKLLQEAAYIKSEPAKDPLDTIYYLDLEANAAQIIAQETKAILKDLDTSLVLPEVLNLINPVYLPLADLMRVRVYRTTIQWQNTPREARVILRDLRGVSLQEIQRLYMEILTTEVDFCLLLGLPEDAAKQQGYIKQLLEFDREGRHTGSMFVWLPEEIQDMDKVYMMYSHLMLKKQLLSNPEAKELLRILNEMLEKEIALVKELFINAYFNGTIFSVEGQVEINLLQTGYLPFEKMLGTVLNDSLERVYPRHREIMPYTESISRHTVEALWDSLIFQGKIAVKEARDKAVLAPIEGVLIPLGVVSKKGNFFNLTIEPGRNELLTDYLSYILPDNPIPVSDLYLKMRKGLWGLTKHPFYLLTAILIQSGYLTPYKEGRVVIFSSIAKFYNDGVGELGEGKLIEAQYQPILKNASFIWGEREITPFNLSLQKELWELAIRFKQRVEKNCQEIQGLLQRYSDYPSFGRIPIREIEEKTGLILQLCDEIKTSYDSRNGLERCLGFISEHPQVGETYPEVMASLNFLQVQIEEYTRIFNYLTHPNLFIPSSYHQLKERHQQLLSGGLLNIGEIIFKGRFEGFKGDFYSFYEGYQNTYLTAHQEFYGDEYFRQINGIRQSMEYKLLSRLSGLSFVVVRNDLVRAEQLLREATSSCQRNPRTELGFSPQCSCGYKLGDTVSGPEAGEIMDTIVSGIGEYICGLQAGRARERLELYMRHLSELGRAEECSEIQKLLSLDVQNLRTLVVELRYLLTGEMMARISKALMGQVLVVERDINELLLRLEGRRFTRQTILNIIDEWLKQGAAEGTALTDDVYIQIRPHTGGNGSRREQMTGGLSEEALDDYFAPVRDVIAEDGERFREAFWIACCLAQHNPLSAGESLLLRGHYHLDISRIGLLLEHGKQLLKQGESPAVKQATRTSLLPRAGRQLLKQGEPPAESTAALTNDSYPAPVEARLSNLMREQILFELKINTLSQAELLEFIRNERVFEFVSKEACICLLKQLMAAPHLSGVLPPVPLPQGEGKGHRDTKGDWPAGDIGWPHLHLMNNIGSILTILNTPRTEGDIVAEYTGVISGLNFMLEQLLSLNLRQEFLPQAMVNELLTVVEGRIAAYTDRFRQVGRPGQHPDRGGITNRDQGISAGDFLQQIYHDYRVKYPDSNAYIVILDGMRWDLWEYLLPSLEASLPHHRLTEVIPILAIEPTTTVVNRRAILGSTAGEGETLTDEPFGRILNEEFSMLVAADRVYHQDELIDLIESDVKLKVINFNLIDSRLHNATGDLYHLYSEIELDVKGNVVPFLKRFQPDSLIFILSDHGFRYLRRSHQPYTHGGGTPFERVVPCGVWVRR